MLLDAKVGDIAWVKMDKNVNIALNNVGFLMQAQSIEVKKNTPVVIVKLGHTQTYGDYVNILLPDNQVRAIWVNDLEAEPTK